MSSSSSDFDQHFTRLRNYVTQIKVADLSLDNTQTKAWPGISAEILAIGHATATYKILKDRLANVHKQLTDQFPSNRKTWHERDVDKLKGDNWRIHDVNESFNSTFNAVRGYVQSCIDDCEREIQSRTVTTESRTVTTRIKKFFGRDSEMKVLLARLKECDCKLPTSQNLPTFTH